MYEVYGPFLWFSCYASYLKATIYLRKTHSLCGMTNKVHCAVLTVSKTNKKHAVFFSGFYISLHYSDCYFLKLWFHPCCLWLHYSRWILQQGSRISGAFSVRLQQLMSAQGECTRIHTHTHTRAHLNCLEHDPDQGRRDHGNAVHMCVCVSVCERERECVCIPLKTCT